MKHYFFLAGFGIMIYCLTCSQSTNWSPVMGDIMTIWTKKVSPRNVLPEYPRPQLVRTQWKNLNGLWDYAIRPESESHPDSFDGKILVPFPVESALSGVKKMVGKENKLWYRRTFEIPKKWLAQRVILNFGAVDWETTVWINGQQVGRHRGGYDGFSFDVTNFLKAKGQQEIVVSVWDPIDSSHQPRGKQVQNPGGIWYTSVTGIWQTVWLEPVPAVYIEALKIIPDVDANRVRIVANCSSTRPDYRIRITVREGNTREFAAEGIPFDEIPIPIDQPKWWSPDSPFLYDLDVMLVNGIGERIDRVTSYFGMRKNSIKTDEKNIPRIFLNNNPIFMHGPLDQGWWPDGLYTAPTDAALRYDIEVTKQLGFNVARKHVKIEPDRWYYWCDKLGLLVWQDMPSGDEYIGSNDPDLQRSDASAFQFKTELKAMIDGRYNHPSIVMWVPFNEGWGQFETEGISRWIKSYDPTRLVNNASGWTDRGVGDVHDIHAYPGPAKPENELNRAAVLGEYGGLGLPLLDHSWRQEKNWGYRGYRTPNELTLAYQELTRKLLPLIPDGLCAAIYTQTTDVEIEVNGLMTYDRKVIKMNLETVRLINQGFLSPEVISEDEIFLDQARIQLKSQKGGEIRFTRDGSEPIRKSNIYSGPLLVENSTTIKARTFWDNGIESLVATFTCNKVSLIASQPLEQLAPGVKVDYYEGEWDSLPDFSAMTPVFSKIVREINLAAASRNELFGLKFDGFIRLSLDGIYTFYTSSDDGSKLFIDDQLIVTNDGLHGMREEYGKVALQAGDHKIRVEFFQKKGGVGLEVYWKGMGSEKGPIPSAILFHL